MLYNELYLWVQQQSLPISRSKLKPEICRLSKHQNLRVFLDHELGIEDAAGYFVDPGDDHRFAKQSGGCPLIVLSTHLDENWSRLVWTKEAMHMLDTPLERTSCPAEFVNLIGEFATTQPENSLQMKSEILSFWMAMGLLCPEEARQELCQAGRNGEMTNAEIANKIRLPERCLPDLFHSNFKETIEVLRSKPAV